LQEQQFNGISFLSYGEKVFRDSQFPNTPCPIQAHQKHGARGGGGGVPLTFYLSYSSKDFIARD
jgi:hypothetical protein